MSRVGLCVLVFPLVALAEPDGGFETVVTASRIEAPASELGRTVTRFDAERIEGRQAVSVVDLLREVPGLSVVQSGGLGSVTSVFTRGTNANHTLVLIDGMEASDPSAFDTAFDFADLSTDALERVEVLRGPASSLYGSDALGGVIHLVTRRGKGAPSAAFSAETGAFGTFRASARADGRSALGSYSLSAGRLISDGISQASARAGNLEPDGYGRTTIHGRVTLTAASPLEASLALRYQQSSSDLDDFATGVGPVDDPNFTQGNDKLLLRPQLRAELFGGRWTPSLALTVGRDHRLSRNDADAANPGTSRGQFHGDRLQLTFQNELRPSASNQAVVLLEWERQGAQTSSSFESSFGVSESALARSQVSNVALLAQDRQRLTDWLSISGSVRLDAHSTFGTALTHSASLIARVPGAQTVLHLTEGTGFKAPSILQLRDPLFGNPSLQPERSLALEAGIEQPLGSQDFKVSATGFLNRVEALIGFDPSSFQSVNQGSARIWGLEVWAQARWRWLTARADYTYLVPRDLATGEDLLRRPRHKAGGGVDLAPNARLQVTTRVDVVGGRDDLDFASFPARKVSLKPYVLGTVAASFEVHSGIFVMARLENAFDQRYEEVLGFGAPGLAAYAGVRADL